MFRDLFHQYEWQAVQHSIYAKTAADVERAQQQPKRTVDDFQARISPAALPYLEPMARLWQALTHPLHPVQTSMSTAKAYCCP